MLGNDAPVESYGTHKMRNALDHLLEEQCPWVRPKVAAAWVGLTPIRLGKRLRHWQTLWRRTTPGAGASLREGPEETITINRLMLTGAFGRTLRSTNPLESAIGIARAAARRVKRWRNGNQVSRWTMAGLKEAGQ